MASARNPSMVSGVRSAPKLKAETFLAWGSLVEICPPAMSVFPIQNPGDFFKRSEKRQEKEDWWNPIHSSGMFLYVASDFVVSKEPLI
jgi:hypothetical protein